MKTIERIIKSAYFKLKEWIFKVHPKYWFVSVITLLLTFLLCAFLYKDSSGEAMDGGIPYIVIGVTLILVCFAKRKFMSYIWYSIPIIISALLMQELFKCVIKYLGF